jgi:hypothetical protein
MYHTFDFHPLPVLRTGQYLGEGITLGGVVGNGNFPITRASLALTMGA